MGYAVKEIYYTLQGEGANTGRPAVFCRFTGCNLWSGREQDRSSAVCQFCDTDFVGTDGPGGGRFESAAALAEAVAACWPRNEVDADAKRTHDAGAGPRPMVVCTGGGPLLQLDASLIEAFHALGFEVAIETNGTKPVPEGVDWVCVSPKAGEPLVVEGGDELKLVYPQAGARVQHGGGVGLLPAPSRVAPVAADPQAHRYPIGRHDAREDAVRRGRRGHAHHVLPGGSSPRANVAGQRGHDHVSRKCDSLPSSAQTGAGQQHTEPA